MYFLLVNFNSAFYDPLGCLPAVENILQGGDVVGGGDPVQAVQEVLHRVRQLKLVTAVKSSLDAIVCPQVVEHRLQCKMILIKSSHRIIQLSCRLTLKVGKVLLLRLAVLSNNSS